ncbi:hypothetical protein [Sphingomonas cannabina]|nr:hypothetical protein [Sphingomonas cannabina]
MRDKSHDAGLDPVLMALLAIVLMAAIVLGILFKLWAATGLG